MLTRAYPLRTGGITLIVYRKRKVHLLNPAGSGGLTSAL